METVKGLATAALGVVLGVGVVFGMLVPLSLPFLSASGLWPLILLCTKVGAIALVDTALQNVGMPEMFRSLWFSAGSAAAQFWYLPLLVLPLMREVSVYLGRDPFQMVAFGAGAVTAVAAILFRVHRQYASDDDEESEGSVRVSAVAVAFSAPLVCVVSLWFFVLLIHVPLFGTCSNDSSGVVHSCKPCGAEPNLLQRHTFTSVCPAVPLQQVHLQLYEIQQFVQHQPHQFAPVAEALFAEPVRQLSSAACGEAARSLRPGDAYRAALIVLLLELLRMAVLAARVAMRVVLPRAWLRRTAPLFLLFFLLMSFVVSALQLPLLLRVVPIVFRGVLPPWLTAPVLRVLGARNYALPVADFISTSLLSLVSQHVGSVAALEKMVCPVISNFYSMFAGGEMVSWTSL